MTVDRAITDRGPGNRALLRPINRSIGYFGTPDKSVRTRMFYSKVPLAKNVYFRMENEIFVIQQHRIEQHKEFEEAFKISQCNFTEYRTQLGKFS